MKWTVLLALGSALPAYAQLPGGAIADRPCADTVAYTEIPEPECSLSLLATGTAIFTTEAELREQFVRFGSSCDTAELLHIDFTTKMLIGRWIHLGNCAAGRFFTVSVCRDDSAHAYRHIVTTSSNPCRGLSSVTSWIVIPKPPEGYTVVFEGAWW